MSISKVLLISTGGTISGEVAQTIREEEVIRPAKEFIGLMKSALTSIKNVHGIEVIIDHIPICNIDSSYILPKHWIKLSNTIKKNYDKYDSFIITHGTNTLGYTCAALSYAFANLGKPVILTGSQVPAGMPGSDAIINLENALRLSAIPFDDFKIMGVLAVFGSHIISGTRVKKDTEFDYDAFKSHNQGSLGRIGRIIDIDKINMEKHNAYLKTNKFSFAKKAKKLICENKFETRIVSLTEFPGMNPDIFETLVDKHDIKGFILRSFGAGDPSKYLLPGFKFLKGRGIPLVITSQAPNGNSNFQVNAPGVHLKENDLAIPAYDMSIEAITAKLAWLLGKDGKNKLSYDEICSTMVNDIRGAINVIWEVKM